MRRLSTRPTQLGRAKVTSINRQKKSSTRNSLRFARFADSFLGGIISRSCARPSARYRSWKTSLLLVFSNPLGLSFTLPHSVQTPNFDFQLGERRRDREAYRNIRRNGKEELNNAGNEIRSLAEREGFGQALVFASGSNSAQPWVRNFRSPHARSPSAGRRC